MLRRHPTPLSDPPLRRRALWALLCYALFALAPGAHELWHDHGLRGTTAVRLGPPDVVPACAGACSAPHHRHHVDHGAAEHCVVCKISQGAGDPLEVARIALAAPPPAHDLAALGAPSGASGGSQLHRARGPPGLRTPPPS